MKFIIGLLLSLYFYFLRKSFRDRWDALASKGTFLKPSDLSLTPGPHMAEEENWLPYAVLWPPQVHTHNTNITQKHTQQMK